MTKLDKLLIELEQAMEEGWINHANGEPTSDDIYFVIEELEDMGLGAVLIPTIHGRMKWFDLREMAF